jgi:RHS repeat-associated protein
VAKRGWFNLPGGGFATYDQSGSGLTTYNHPDHLGSIRLGSAPNRTFLYSKAYAPFGEVYAPPPTNGSYFTGQGNFFNLDTYEFPAREYSDQGRWPSPDPAGLAAVDPTNPQSWNRYAYVTNNPLALIDPQGLGQRPILNSPIYRTPWNCDALGNCGDGGGGGDCTLDGISTSCSTVQGLANGGGTAICLNSTCTLSAPLEPLIEGSGVYQGTLQLPGYATYAGLCPNQDCSTTPPMIEVNPIAQFLVTLSAGSAGSAGSGSGSGSTLDARANALAAAINKTGVQSLGNPCTIGLFYAGSAAGAVGVSAISEGRVFPMIFDRLIELAIQYDRAPRAVRWLAKQGVAMVGVGVANLGGSCQSFQ